MTAPQWTPHPIIPALERVATGLSVLAFVLLAIAFVEWAR